jgi:hypothetical protein
VARNTLAIADALADRALTFMANYNLAIVAFQLGAYDEAAAACRSLLESPQYERVYVPGFPRAIVHGWRAGALAHRGEFEKGIAEGLSGVQQAEAELRWP